MRRKAFRVKETIATIIAEKRFIEKAEAEIFRQRKFIEDYILEFPIFRTTLEPFPVSPDAPEVVRRMAEASAKVNVGPMAAVAGAIAEFALKAMTGAGAAHAIVDNGGDIAMALSYPVTVGIFTGPAKIKDIGLRFRPRSGIIGVCTSSGTVGHSLSFGRADAATVISPDVCLADAAATALGNAVKDKNPALIEEAMKGLLAENIEGMLVVMDDLIGMSGNLPEIIRVQTDIKKGQSRKGKERGIEDETNKSRGHGVHRACRPAICEDARQSPFF